MKKGRVVGLLAFPSLPHCLSLVTLTHSGRRASRACLLPSAEALLGRKERLKTVPTFLVPRTLTALSFSASLFSPLSSHIFSLCLPLLTTILHFSLSLSSTHILQ